jgi:hypothetical protein
MQRIVLVHALVAGLWSAGCTDSPAPDVVRPVMYTPSPDGDGALTPIPGFPGRSQPLGTAHHTTVFGITRGAEGAIWVARTDDGSLDIRQDRTLIVERFDPALGAGTVVAQASIRPKTFSANEIDRVALCSHPSGEITLAAFTSIPGETTAAALVLTRFSADGTAVRTGYIDEADARMIDGHGAYFTGNDLDCASAGEDVFLVAVTQGMRLYRVASDLGVRWSQPVMPMTMNLALQPIYSTRARVTVSNDGGAVTASTLWSDDAGAFADAFGATLPATNGDADVLVTRFDAEGARVSAGLLGGPGAEWVRGLQVRGDRVSVLAEARLVKHPDRPNGTRERDLILLEGDAAQNLTAQAVQINLCDDDFVSGAIADPEGGFLVAGGTCGVQADSGSLIANRTGYVLTLGADGTRQAVAWFTSARDTEVQALMPLSSGELALAGIRNGPITHTDERELSNEAWIDIVAAPAPR